MNLKQINEFRVAHNMVPLVVAPKKGNNGNAAKRAQECRNLKAKRNSGKK